MVDVVSKEVRSRMMSGIRGKNTKHEITIQKALLKNGFRFKLHDRTLPGKPDLVLPSHNSVIFIHGCFWHGHDCHLFKWPTTRPDFWREKINRNKEIDKINLKLLKKDNWYILTIWECALKGRTRKPLDFVIDKIEHWLIHETRNKEIKGSKSIMRKSKLM